MNILKKKNLSMQMAVIMSLRITGAVGGLAASMILVNLDTNVFVNFSIFLVIVTLASTFSIFGLDILLIRELSNRNHCLKMSNESLLQICVIASLFISVLSAVLTIIMAPKIYENLDVVNPVVIFVSIVSLALSKICVPILRNEKYYLAAQLIEAGLQPSLFLLLIIGGIFIKIPINYIFDAFMVSTIFTSTIGVFYIYKICEFRRLKISPRLEEVKYLGKESFSFLASTFSFILSNRVDVLIFVIIFSKLDFATYRLSAQVFELSAIVSTTFLATYASTIASELKKGSYRNLQLFLVKGIRLNFIFMIVGTIIFIIIGNIICQILFPEVSNVYSSICLFLVARLLTMFVPSGNLILDLSGKQWIPLIGNVMLIFAIVLLALIFGQNLSLYGAIFLVGILHVLRNIFNEIFSKKITGVNISIFSRRR